MLKKRIILIAMTMLAALLTTSVLPKIGRTFGERDGQWTATEKRQVISLLEQIAASTEHMAQYVRP